MKTVRVKMLKPAVRINAKSFPEALQAGQELMWDADDALRASEAGLLEILADAGEAKRK